MLRYPTDVRWSDEDGRWIADVFDLPGCAGAGRTAAEAIKEAAVAARAWIAAAKAERQSVPPPSQYESGSGSFVVRITKSLHGRLRRQAQREGVSLNQLVLSLLSEREAERRIQSPPVVPPSPRRRQRRRSGSR